MDVGFFGKVFGIRMVTFLGGQKADFFWGGLSGCWGSILDFFGKVIGIRMVTFWGVRKLNKIDWRPLFLILGLFKGTVSQSVSQSVSRQDHYKRC